MTDSPTPSPSPSTGVAVLHLFLKPTPLADRDEALAALDGAKDLETQVVTVAMLGHKADLAVMGLNNDVWALRRLQTDLVAAGFDLVDSYLSITELSEYAAGLPEQMQNDRLYPQLPPDGKHAWCFYPMSKRRNPGQNWYTTDFDRRKELMYEHGTSGRKFAGRLVQLITGSTGLDDYEWGVTLFAQHVDDLKEVVYTMRFDEASAEFAEFGPFYTGMVADAEDALNAIGIV
ncbi:MAG: chlorite dismutase family protein [Acidimicrobiales bacterium]